MKPKNILVPVDFSPFSDSATDYAIYFARKHDAEITLYHTIVLYDADVEEEAHVRHLEEIIKRKEEHTHELFKKHSDQITAKGIKINTKIERSISAANSILDYLSENNFDLVVMGTHGRTGIKKWIYGSVAEKVVRLSHTPVLTVHNTPEEIQFKNILVPVDFSENSRHGINAALQLADDFDSNLHFIHVIEQQLHPSFNTVGIESILAFNPELKNISEEKLREFCDVGRNEHYSILEGPAHQIISEYAAENGIDMITMATRGFTGLDHLLIGSTTERVIRIAPCPVLTVGRHEH